MKHLTLLPLLALVSCASFPNPASKTAIPISDVEAPGFLDVGVGFGVAFDTHDGDNNDARGTLLSVKGYPWGRWYSKKEIAGDTQFAEQVVASTDHARANGLADDQVQAVVDGLLQDRDRFLADDSYYPIAERNQWYNRLSVFYGKSIGDFNGGNLESSVDVVGLGFDVAPQMALQLGWAFYDVDEGGGLDTDAGLTFSVSLNLNTFKSVFGELGG